MRSIAPKVDQAGLAPRVASALLVYVVSGFVAAGGAMAQDPANSDGTSFAAPILSSRVEGGPLGNGPSIAEIVDAASHPENWVYHTRDLQGTRFSPLDQLNPSNAGRLAPVCVFQLADAGNFQTGPIVYDGVMYVTGVYLTVALDAATCRPIWRHRWRPRGDESFTTNRGVAISGGYVVRGTSDGYLLALDAADGELVWARQVADASIGETFTMAPMIYGDRIFIGPAVSEYGIQGWLGAFALEDGAPLWRFEAVAGARGEGDHPWENPTGIPLGGGAIWTPLSMDVERNEIYVSVSNPAPDFPAYLRPGLNLYTNSVVALNPDTGEILWYRQLVPNDDHDWDLTQVSPVFDLPIASDGSEPSTGTGATRAVVATAGKDGILRLLDRDSRDLVWETEVTTLENVDAPITSVPQRVCPGVLGGVLWNGPALLPDPGVLVVPAVDYCTVFTAAEQVELVPDRLYMGGTNQMVGERRGWLTAVNALDGSIRWRYRSEDAMIGAVTTTAGGLVLTGEQTGDFLVLAGESGEELFRFYTGGPIGAGVITYAVDGRQYVAVGSGRPSGYWVQAYMGSPTILVFAVPED